MAFCPSHQPPISVTSKRTAPIGRFYLQPTYKMETINMGRSTKVRVLWDKEVLFFERNN